MCLYPKLIRNKKYCPTKKNGYRPPTLRDERLKYVAIGCGKCIECKKQLANAWRIRLNEENKVQPNALFVTLTFSEESLDKICENLGVQECNAVAGYAVRMFLERWRKKYKKSLRHWLITELGHTGTERIHLHGILYTNETDDVTKLWQYGYTFIGDYVCEKTVNYIVKYVTKTDPDHKQFQQQIFCSSGIGRSYIEKWSTHNYHRYRPNQTIETYKLNNGHEVGLPMYYRNHIYSEEEREKLWIERQELQTRWVMGEKIKMTDEDWETLYNELLRNARKKNAELGYGDYTKLWKRKEYNVRIRELQKLTREKHEPRYFDNPKRPF